MDILGSVGVATGECGCGHWGVWVWPLGSVGVATGECGVATGSVGVATGECGCGHWGVWTDILYIVISVKALPSNSATKATPQPSH